MKLSSRLLLVILNELPDTSRFKTQALRDGDWTVHQKIAAKHHDEAAKLRASYIASHGGEGDDIMFTPFETPVEERARLKELMAEAELYGDESLDDMSDSLFGWS
jgi:hypothetical protein